MKVLSLNVWGGRNFDSLMEYIKEQSESVDVFCFQEIFDTPTNKKTVESGENIYRANLLSELKNALKYFKCFFAPMQDNWDFNGKTDFPISYGIAIFIKKPLKIKDVGDFFVFGRKNSWIEGNNATLPRKFQYAFLENNKETYLISHFHGIWNHTKTDNKDRIRQSKLVKGFLDKFDGKKIVCGDFNLKPDTKSIAILDEGMVNLIKKYGIKSTRNAFNTWGIKFADYIIVSPNINVKDFEVPYNEVSDHLPMILEFE